MAAARLFFEAPDGSENTQVSVQSIGQGATRQVATYITADDVVGLTPGIEPGTYDGQPAAWAEEAAVWQGLVFGSPLVFQRWTSPAQILIEPTTSLGITVPDDVSIFVGGGAFAALNMGSTGVVLQSGTSLIFNATEVDGIIQMNAHGVQLTMLDDYACLTLAGACAHRQTDDEHTFSVPNAAGTEEISNVIFSHLGDAPTVGFLGAADVARQSITGATTADQVDSLVAALVALGLVSDNRTSPVQSQIGWAPTAALQTSNVLTLMPAGHTPGLYRINCAQMVRTVGGSSVGQETWTWSDGGAQTITTGLATTTAPRWNALGLAAATSNIIQYPRTIHSDGVSAITLQVTAQGTVNTPIIDIYASAQR